MICQFATPHLIKLNFILLIIVCTNIKCSNYLAILMFLAKNANINILVAAIKYCNIYNYIIIALKCKLACVENVSFNNLGN